MQFDRRLYQALLRNDFRAFTEKVFLTLNPGENFVWSWYFDAVAWQLERVRRGETKRLIINLPPRSLKSIMASVAWPAFILGLDPSKRIICVSYSGDLARKFSNDFRALIDTHWYKTLFPWTRIGEYKDSEIETQFTARESRLATSVGGTLTGRGGDIIVIDDPLRADDATSETKRTGANLWFNNTLLSRLDDKRVGAIVVAMQRVHIDDLTGFLLAQSDEWKVISFPAIAHLDAVVPTWNELEQAAAADLNALQSDLARLRAIRSRHSPELSPLCDDFQTERDTKVAAEVARDAARVALDNYRTNFFQPIKTLSTSTFGGSMRDFG